VSSARTTHYWDLITKYFEKEYQSIEYINTEYAISQEEEITKQEKALTWLIIMLNEDQLLYYCFHSIFKTGAFLSYYDENQSFLFNENRQ